LQKTLVSRLLKPPSQSPPQGPFSTLANARGPAPSSSNRRTRVFSSNLRKQTPTRRSPKPKPVSIFFVYFRNWSVLFHERLRTLAFRPPPSPSLRAQSSRGPPAARRPPSPGPDPQASRAPPPNSRTLSLKRHPGGRSHLSLECAERELKKRRMVFIRICLFLTGPSFVHRPQPQPQPLCWAETGDHASTVDPFARRSPATRQEKVGERLRCPMIFGFHPSTLPLFHPSALPLKSEICNRAEPRSGGAGFYEEKFTTGPARVFELG